MTNNKDDDEQKYISTPSAAIYFSVNSAIAAADFAASENDGWPTSDLTNARRTIKAHAQLRPGTHAELLLLTDSQLEAAKQKMAAAVLSLSDLSADVFDICMFTWLKNASHPSDWATISVDEFLRLRGMARRSLKQSWRETIASQIQILSNLWVSVAEMEVPTRISTKAGKSRTVMQSWQGESRAIHLDFRAGPRDRTGTLQPRMFRLKPGQVFAQYLIGPGHQTCLLAQKALEFDYDKHKYCKRLTRWLAYQWRTRVRSGNYIGPFKVQTILSSIDLEVDPRRPNRTKEILERDLQRLVDEKIIRGFQYDNFDESIVGKKGWVKDYWLESLIEIEPPEFIQEHYQKKISNPTVKQVASSSTKMAPLEELRVIRKRLGMSQQVLAEQLQITTVWLCMLERGTKQPSSDLLLRIRRWLASQS